MRWFDDFVALDLETTGLSPAKNRICQVAALRFVGFEETGRFVTYVDPGVPIPPGINAVSDDDVRGAPKFAEVAVDVVRTLLRAPVLVYNAPFDVPFLAAALRRARFRVPAALDVARTLDPLVWVRDFDRYVRGRGRHKLTTTAERRGVRVEGTAHDAAVDCRLAAGVARTLEVDVPRDLERLLRWQVRKREDQERERREYRARLKAEREARNEAS